MPSFVELQLLLLVFYKEMHSNQSKAAAMVAVQDTKMKAGKETYLHMTK